MRTKQTLVVLFLTVFSFVSLMASGQKDAENMSDELVQISWHQIGNPQELLPEVMVEVNKYLAEKIGAELYITVHGWGDYTTKMQTMHAAGEPFDLAFTAPWANPFVPTASKGAYYPLDDLLKEYGKDILAKLPADYWKASTIDGKINAIINLQIMSNQRGVAVLKTYADKYNFDPAKMTSNQELFDFFEKIKKNEPDVIPYFSNKEGIYPDLTDEKSKYWDAILGENAEYIGVRMNDKSRTVINTIITDEYKQNIKSVRDMLDTGYIPSDFATLNLDEEVKGKDYAAFVMTRIKPGVEGENRVRYGKDTIVFGFHKPYVSTDSVQSTMTAIGINSKHPEKAMELYNLVYSDPYLYNLLVFGIEGVHYTLGADGYVTQNSEKAYGLPAWQFGNQFNAYLMPGQDVDVWDQTIALDKAAELSPILGFVFDPTPVRNEIAACSAIFEEYKSTVFYADDLDKMLDEFNTTLVNSGVDKIIVETQKQIDAWSK